MQWHHVNKNKCVIEKIKSKKGNEIRIWRVNHCERDIVQDGRRSGRESLCLLLLFCWALPNHKSLCHMSAEQRSQVWKECSIVSEVNRNSLLPVPSRAGGNLEGIPYNKYVYAY